MTNGGPIRLMSRIRKGGAHPLLKTYKNEPFPALRDAKMRSIEDSPIAIIAQIHEIFMHLRQS